jgi:hypothetical protein
LDWEKAALEQYLKERANAPNNDSRQKNPAAGPDPNYQTDPKGTACTRKTETPIIIMLPET